jgi:hypothetical protein
MTVGKIRKANRAQAKPLIGLYSESGAGKTKSALLLARGFVGDKGRVVMIETEAGRGEVFVDEIPGGYDVISIRDDFSSRAYGEAMTAAEREHVDAVIIDSASHEWEGVGGVLSMAADNQERGKKGPLVWQQPKILHQREFTGRLLQTPASLVIVCMRAKYPMEEAQVGGKKEWRRSDELSPKQSEDILFELMVHGWISKGDHKFHGTKYTTEDLRAALRDGEPISLETGRRLAAWAAGGGAAKRETPPPIPKDAEPPHNQKTGEVLGQEEEEALALIAGCETLGSLDSAGAAIKGMDLDAAAKARARAAFVAKQATLKHMAELGSLDDVPPWPQDEPGSNG